MGKSKLTVGIIKEILDDETRVAATPKTVKQIKKKGFEVIVEKDAGLNSFISNQDYEAAGATILNNQEIYSLADILIAINPPEEHPETKKHQIDMLKKESTWISLIMPDFELNSIKKAIKNNTTLFSLNLIPRISRAQDMDVLSSQSNIAGYKAVIMAANELGKLFPLMMTAAGTINPAKIIILGAGVAGLQAIATAKRLGAQIEVSDVRPEVKEQVESIGGTFIEVESDEQASDEQGYAKQVSKEYLQKQAEEVKKRIKTADVVITTALVAGKKAPVLISEEMVKSMKTGSVIVDLAAVQGGNCALTESGRTVIKEGVKIIGHNNIPATTPIDSTNMISSNIFKFLSLIIKEGKLNLDMEDEIIKSSLVTKDGDILNKQTKELIEKELVEKGGEKDD